MTIPALALSRRKLLTLVGLLVVALAIPTTVILIRQRQELRKGAEVGEDVVEVICNDVTMVTLGPPSESYNAATSTYTLTAPIKNNRAYSLNQVKLRWEAYHCHSKDTAICDQNRQVSEEDIGLEAGEQKALQKSVTQKLGDDCGSLQIDLVILSIDGDTSCGTAGDWADLIWGFHRTDTDCEEESPSPAPEEPEPTPPESASGGPPPLPTPTESASGGPTPPAESVPSTAIAEPTLITLFLGITLTLLGIHVIL